MAARCADLGVGKLCCLLPRENCADAFFGGSQQREHILTDTAFLLSALAANGHDIGWNFIGLDRKPFHLK